MWSSVPCNLLGLFDVRKPMEMYLIADNFYFFFLKSGIGFDFRLSLDFSVICQSVSNTLYL